MTATFLGNLKDAVRELGELFAAVKENHIGGLPLVLPLALPLSREREREYAKYPPGSLGDTIHCPVPPPEPVLPLIDAPTDLSSRGGHRRWARVSLKSHTSSV